MPIHVSIDHTHRLVIARGEGTFTDDDAFGYQRGVWSQPEVAGYNELIDMTDVEEIALPSYSRVEVLASLSASMDDPDQKSKSAVVAPSDLAFGLGRMFEMRRSMSEKSTKEVRVFRTLPEALEFLGLKDIEIYGNPAEAER
jgi:hypothetical protein